MIQLILHLWGDYILQSSWMAENKSKRWWPAFVHAAVYSFGFSFIASPLALMVILFSHLLIDRYRLARFLIWSKDILLRPNGLRIDPWSECSATGYHKDVPVWLSTWLLIIADNTLHLTINFLSLRYL